MNLKIIFNKSYVCKVPKAEEFVLLKRPKTLLQANKAEEFELLHSNNKLIRQRNLICSKSQAQDKSLEGPKPIHRAGAPLEGARAVFS